MKQIFKQNFQKRLSFPTSNIINFPKELNLSDKLKFINPYIFAT